MRTLRTGKYTGDAGRHRYLLSKSPPQIEGGLLYISVVHLLFVCQMDIKENIYANSSRVANCILKIVQYGARVARQTQILSVTRVLISVTVVTNSPLPLISGN